MPISTLMPRSHKDQFCTEENRSSCPSLYVFEDGRHKVHQKKTRSERVRISPTRKHSKECDHVSLCDRSLLESLILSTTRSLPRLQEDDLDANASTPFLNHRSRIEITMSNEKTFPLESRYRESEDMCSKLLQCIQALSGFRPRQDDHWLQYGHWRYMMPRQLRPLGSGTATRYNGKWMERAVTRSTLRFSTWHNYSRADYPREAEEASRNKMFLLGMSEDSEVRNISFRPCITLTTILILTPFGYKRPLHNGTHLRFRIWSTGSSQLRSTRSISLIHASALFMAENLKRSSNTILHNLRQLWSQHSLRNHQFWQVFIYHVMRKIVLEPLRRLIIHGAEFDMSIKLQILWLELMQISPLHHRLKEDLDTSYILGEDDILMQDTSDCSTCCKQSTYTWQIPTCLKKLVKNLMSWNGVTSETTPIIGHTDIVTKKRNTDCSTISSQFQEDHVYHGLLSFGPTWDVLWIRWFSIFLVVAFLKFMITHFRWFSMFYHPSWGGLLFLWFSICSRPSWGGLLFRCFSMFFSSQLGWSVESVIFYVFLVPAGLECCVGDFRCVLVPYVCAGYISCFLLFFDCVLLVSLFWLLLLCCHAFGLIGVDWCIFIAKCTVGSELVVRIVFLFLIFFHWLCLLLSSVSWTGLACCVWCNCLSVDFCFLCLNGDSWTSFLFLLIILFWKCFSWICDLDCSVCEWLWFIWIFLFVLLCFSGWTC